jgi:hypothetical protein
MSQIVYKIEPEYINVYFNGTIKIEGILKLMNDIDYEMSLRHELKIIVDSREAQYETKPSDLPSIVAKLIEYGKNFSSIRLSIIQKSPYETAISMIMMELLKGISNISCRVCSTDEKAIEWLQ